MNPYYEVLQRNKNYIDEHMNEYTNILSNWIICKIFNWISKLVDEE